MNLKINLLLGNVVRLSFGESFLKKKIVKRQKNLSQLVLCMCCCGGGGQYTLISAQI